MAWVTKLKNHKLTVTLLVLAPILGALITTVNFAQKWDEWQLPRPAFTSDVAHHTSQLEAQITDLQNLVLEIELKFLEFAIRAYARNLRMLHQEIQDLRTHNTPVPDNLLEHEEILTTELATFRIRLRELRP